ncbi:MAG: PEGA domain-containing protein [Methanophagales archaeon ANME-1-THS]|nr:MAG: PEGA domain-containing protein [Methanophagales archaeon ANME-1-THS]
MNHTIARPFLLVTVIVILLASCTTPALAYEWSMWISLDKTQYPANSFGEASITVQNKALDALHITRILIAFDWMEGYPEHPDAFTKDVDVFLGARDTKVIGTVHFDVPYTVPAGYHRYKIGLEVEEIDEGPLGSEWAYRGIIWESKTYWVEVIHVGSLDVSSVPDGASIYLDGTYMGTTPQLISNVPVGTHSILLNLSTYNDETTTVNVAFNQVAHVSERLSPTPKPTAIVPSTTAPTATPTSTPNPALNPAPKPTSTHILAPAFDVVGAIAGMLAVAYLLKRRG